MFVINPYKTYNITRSKSTKFEGHLFEEISAETHKVVFRIITDWYSSDSIRVKINYKGTKIQTLTENNFNFINLLNFIINYILILTSIYLFIYSNHTIKLLILLIIIISHVEQELQIHLKITTNDIYVNLFPYKNIDDKLLNFSITKLNESFYKKIEYSKCQFCDIENDKNINISRSTERDVCIMTNIGNSAEPYSAISLRSVGFKGKIFMFSDKPISSKFEECGISWIPTSLFCNIEYEKMYTRYIIIKEFIELFYESIDRLLYFDWGDTHFQSDPFTFDDKSLHVSDERIKFGEEKFNDVWISRINFMKTEYFLNKNIICNGLILGDKDSVYKTVSILSSTWIFHEKPLNDQTIYNVLIYSHIPNEIDLHVVVDPNLASISAVILNETMRSIWHIDKLGSFCDSSTGFKPAVIHQYNRNPELTKMFSSQCHYQNTFNIR